MRLSSRPTLAVAALTALACGPPTAAALPPAGPPSLGLRAGCTSAEPSEFPVRTRIHGGPSTYDAGGGFHTWSLDLTNTTDRVCRRLHPVIVLVDDSRVLTAGQPVLEFHEGADTHPVAFERTDADELVGVLDHDGFPGFSVPAGRTLTVRLRLAVTSDAATPNDVVAKAAVVQRQGSDGDWVGESNDYRFRIVVGGTEQRTGTDPGTDPGRDPGRDPGKVPGKEPGKVSGKEAPAGDAPAGTPTAAGTSTAEGTPTKAGAATPTTPDTLAPHDGRLPLAEELARTGVHASAYFLGALLVVTGALLVAVTRRRSR